jgi:hypothetical protein
MNMEFWTTFDGFWNKFQNKKGLKKTIYEYCVSHKNKLEIELIPSGHQVIKNECNMY